MIIWCSNYLGGFSLSRGQQFVWHPFLMYFGFIFCFGNAALSFRILPFAHKTNKVIHLIWQTIGIISICLGLTAVVLYHNENKYPNFYSLHSWIGIVVFGVFCLQYIGGFIGFFYPKVSPRMRSKMLPWHVMFGKWLYVIAGIACLLGIQEKLGFFGGEQSCSRYSTACLIGNSIGLLIFFSVLFLFVSLNNFNAPVKYSQNEASDRLIEERNLFND